MTMRASLIITAKDQASAALGKIAAGAKRMSASFRPVASDAAAADRAIDRVSTTARRGMMHVTGWASRVRKAAADMRIAERAAYGMGYGIGWSIRKMGGLALSTAKWGAAGAAAAAAATTGWFIGGIVRTGSTFEQFQAQLEGTEGSAQKAKAALAWVAKFAAQTPYQLDEVTDAFVRARGVGIDPLTGAMQQMGDAAAANRKTLMDAVEAIADAQTGEFERLKAFNITTSVKGNTVAFSYIDKAGKNAVRTTKKTAKDIQQAVLSIWDERHGGAMIRQSRTLAGIWSNLQDWVMGFQYRIAGKGIFDRIKNSLADLLDTANRLADDGTLDKWAERISDRLSKMWEWGVRFVKETNWQQVGADMREIGKAAWATALAFKEIVKALTDIGNFIGGDGGLLRQNGPLGGFGWNKGFYFVEPKWWTDMQNGANQKPVKSPLKPGAHSVAPWKPASGNASPWTRSGALARPATSIKAPLKPGATAVSPWKPVAAPAKQISSVQRVVNDVTVGGRIGVKIDVKAPAGTTVRTTQLASDNRNVPIDLKTGRSMSEAA